MANKPKFDFERRFFPVTEMRVSEEDGPTLEGYAAVFNSWSEDLGGFKEKIEPGAFAKTIQESDIRALINHDPSLLFGRNKAGTLKLSEDKEGLRYSVKLDTAITYVADLERLIRRGEITGNSFGFSVIKDRWDFAEGKTPDERTLLEVRLWDVGPVTYPAYPETSVKLRSQLPQSDGGERLNAIYLRLSAGSVLRDADLEFIDGLVRDLTGLKPSAPGNASLVSEPVPQDHSLPEPVPMDHSKRDTIDQCIERELLSLQIEGFAL